MKTEDGFGEIWSQGAKWCEREQNHIKKCKRHAALEILDGGKDIERKVLERR